MEAYGGKYMRTNIYIEDGVTQIILTPETEFEKNIIKDFDITNSKTSLFKGSFYDCQGGWVRRDDCKPDSIMIKCDYKKSE